jgi:hypothetical protein
MCKCIGIVLTTHLHRFVREERTFLLKLFMRCCGFVYGGVSQLTFDWCVLCSTVRAGVVRLPF